MNYPDGSFYEGLWRDGKRHGLGVLVDNQGIYVEAVFDEDLNCKPLRVFKKNANGEIILLKTEESLIIEEAQKMLKIHQTPVFLAVQQVAEPLSLNKNNVNE